MKLDEAMRLCFQSLLPRMLTSALLSSQMTTAAARRHYQFLSSATFHTFFSSSLSSMRKEEGTIAERKKAGTSHHFIASNLHVKVPQSGGGIGASRPKKERSPTAYALSLDEHFPD